MLDAIERYIRGEMLPEEKIFFEELRNSNQAIDQMVVEHSLFLQQMSGYGQQRDFRAQLNEMHKGLVRDGEIKEVPPAKLIVPLEKIQTRGMGRRLHSRHYRLVYQQFDYLCLSKGR